MSASGILLAEKLRGLVRGRVAVDEQSLQQYSRDQSIYEIKPLIVILPEDIDDVRRLIEFASREGVPVTPRGGGSGTAGSALGQGIVMAFPDSEFWGRISGLSKTQSTARVLPGPEFITMSFRNFSGSRASFFLPISPAPRSVVSAATSPPSERSYALKYGSIDRFLESIEFVTAMGEFVNTADETTIPARIKTKFAGLSKIRSDNSARALLESRRSLKTSSGYNLSPSRTIFPSGKNHATHGG
jgi:hypothetical protein